MKRFHFYMGLLLICIAIAPPHGGWYWALDLGLFGYGILNIYWGRDGKP